MRLTLDQVSPGKRVKVVSIGGGRGCRQQLFGLGVYPGEVLTVLRSAPFAGPIMVEANGTTFMIGRGMAQRVVVEEVD
ncbi:MAG: ferrous iron transport protein A [Deltaproteobacteria bacterium]|nr:MAG: ferrous iron transport protein A [Deltaproteobacteria bacterium]